MTIKNKGAKPRVRCAYCRGEYAANKPRFTRDGVDLFMPRKHKMQNKKVCPGSYAVASVVEI